MPFQYRHDASVNCLFTLWSPPISLFDLVVFGEKVLSLDCVDERTLRLNDLRVLTGMKHPLDHVRNLGEGMRHWDREIPPHRVAFLVSNDVMHGVAEMIRAVRGEGGDRMAVFWEIQEAVEWLGLPADTGDPFTADRWQAEGSLP